MRRPVPIALITIGLILLVAVPVAWRLNQADRTSGDVTTIEDALRAPGSAVLPSEEVTVTTQDPDPEPLQPEASSTTAGTSNPPPEPEVDDDAQRAVNDPPVVGTPVGLRIDAISVRAPVDAYGVDSATGEMAVPDNTTDVGWYQWGPRPGEAGSAVLAAHVDLAGSGPGVFFDLATLEEGDRIVVDYADGSEMAFRVEARTEYDKNELPLDVIFAREGPPVLTLITCGGDFNSRVRRYDSNVVVYAIPESEPGPAPTPS